MKTIEHYDFDSEGKERFKYLTFEEGTGLDKTHGYSYLHCRNMHKEIGEIMGLEAKINPLPEAKQ